MENTAQFEKVTGILSGVAEKMARLESDPEIKKAAEFWRGQMTASLQPRAVNFARRSRAGREGEGKK